MLSLPDIAILGGLGLIVFGPDKLPAVARQVGHAVGVVRAVSNDFVRAVEAEIPARPAPVESPKPVLARPVTIGADDLPPAI